MGLYIFPPGVTPHENDGDALRSEVIQYVYPLSPLGIFSRAFYQQYKEGSWQYPTLLAFWFTFSGSYTTSMRRQHVGVHVHIERAGEVQVHWGSC